MVFFLPYYSIGLKLALLNSIYNIFFHEAVSNEEWNLQRFLLNF